MRASNVYLVAVLLVLLEAGGLAVCVLDAAGDSEQHACTSCCSVCACSPHAWPLAAAPCLSLTPVPLPVPVPSEPTIVEPEPAGILHVPKSRAA